MSKNIYVGNLPYTTTEAELRDLFSEYGEVHSVNVIEDRETGRSRGFAFVEMDDGAADAAISGLAETMLGDRALNVNEAKPRSDSPRRERQRW